MPGDQSLNYPPFDPLYKGTGIPKTDSEIYEAFEVIQDFTDKKNERDNKNLKIQKLLEDGFIVNEPSGPRYITSKMLYQATWKTAARTKPLDWALYGTNRPRWIERAVTAGVSTVMDKGGYVRSLRDKNGSAWKAILFSDAFTLISPNPRPESKIPIVYNTISNSNVYIDNYAVTMRGQWGQRVTKMVVIFSYSPSEAKALYPKEFPKWAPGPIPRDSGYFKELERSFEQESELNDKYELAYYFDINTPKMFMFAGPKAMQIGKTLKEKEYPFFLDGEPYIPVLHTMCMPSTEGFYNHGLGDSLYQIAVQTQRLLNAGLSHGLRTMNPSDLINVPQGQAATFLRKLKMAKEQEKQGYSSLVVMEYDPNNPGAQTTASNLVTQTSYSEWTDLWERLQREVRRLGVNLDETEFGPNTTATQIISEEENSNMFVKQMMENNASETEFAIRVTMDFIKKFIRTSDKTPLNLIGKIEDEEGEGELDLKNVTLGMIAEELKKFNYFPRVNSRSGAIPSGTFRAAQIARLLQSAQPGTKAYKDLMGEYASIHGSELSGDDFMPEAPPQPEGQPNQEGTPPEEGSPDATQTDRLLLNPNADKKIPAI